MHHRITYIGTATVLLEIGSLRLLTDPAFDPAGTTYALVGLAPWESLRLTGARTVLGAQLGERVLWLDPGVPCDL